MSEIKRDLKSTKEKIKEVALELFAKNGYKATTVRMIAGKLGMRQSALYNHFKNKEAILDSIIDDLNESAIATLFDGKDDESFYKRGKGVLRYIASTFKIVSFDPRNEKLILFILQELYSNEKVREFYQKSLYQKNIKRLSSIFFLMMQDEMIKPYDPLFLANEFFTPLFFYQSYVIQLRVDDKPTSTAAALFEKHVDIFWENIKIQERTYGSF